MELLNYKENCRLCLKTHTDFMKNIFTYNIEGCQETLVQNIYSVLRIKLNQHKDYPQYICRKCLTELENIMLFREDVQRNQNFLLDLLIEAYPDYLEQENCSIDSGGFGPKSVARKKETLFDTKNLETSEYVKVPVSFLKQFSPRVNLQKTTETPKCDNLIKNSKINQKVRNNDVNINESVSVNFCKYCKKVFRSQEILNSHITKIHKYSELENSVIKRKRITNNTKDLLRKKLKCDTDKSAISNFSGAVNEPLPNLQDVCVKAEEQAADSEFQERQAQFLQNFNLIAEQEAAVIRTELESRQKLLKRQKLKKQKILSKKLKRAASRAAAKARNAKTNKPLIASSNDSKPTVKEKAILFRSIQFLKRYGWRRFDSGSRQVIGNDEQNSKEISNRRNVATAKDDVKTEFEDDEFNTTQDCEKNRRLSSFRHAEKKHSAKIGDENISSKNRGVNVTVVKEEIKETPPEILYDKNENSISLKTEKTKKCENSTSKHSYLQPPALNTSKGPQVKFCRTGSIDSLYTTRKLWTTKRSSNTPQGDKELRVELERQTHRLEEKPDVSKLNASINGQFSIKQEDVENLDTHNELITGCCTDKNTKPQLIKVRSKSFTHNNLTEQSKSSLNHRSLKTSNKNTSKIFDKRASLKAIDHDALTVKKEDLSTLQELNDRYEAQESIGLRMKLAKTVSCQSLNSLKYDTQEFDDGALCKIEVFDNSLGYDEKEFASDIFGTVKEDVSSPEKIVNVDLRDEEVQMLVLVTDDNAFKFDSASLTKCERPELSNLFNDRMKRDSEHDRSQRCSPVISGTFNRTVCRGNETVITRKRRPPNKFSPSCSDLKSRVASGKNRNATVSLRPLVTRKNNCLVEGVNKRGKVDKVSTLTKRNEVVRRKLTLPVRKTGRVNEKNPVRDIENASIVNKT